MSPTDQETALVPVGNAGTSAIARTRAAKQIAAPTPIQKAAMILTAIGPELASGILGDLPESDMERFARALAALGKVDQTVLDQVIGEFLELLTSGPEISGGNAAARKLLAGFVDDAEIDRILSNGAPGKVRSVWERMNETPIPALAGLLQGEHPQTAAVILSEMRSEVAASVLERLDRDYARIVVLRLSRVPTLDPAVSQAIRGAIERDFLSVLQRNLSRRRPADLIAGLMNNISNEVREGFLSYLEAQDSRLAKDVQNTMFTFEDVATRLDGRDVAGVLRDLGDEALLKALKLGEMQGSATVAFVLENLPRRLSERYVEELAAMEEVPRKDGEAAQIELTKAIQAQVKEGTIRLVESDPAAG